MILTNEQNNAIKIILDRYKNNEKYAVLCGYAGVGKTTCVKFIVSNLLNSGLNEEDICYASFTGKACQVLIDKGNKNAKTLHKLLYKTIPKSDGTFMHIPKVVGELECKVIIVDEVSMVSKELVDLLLSHPVFVIFCGDNFQLPPINKNDDNHLLDKPHAFLGTVMRQAADSGIIQLSMKIRNGENIDNFKSNDAIVLPKNQLVTGMLTWSDIVLCATNNTRTNLNNQIRELLGKKGIIDEGEKLINTHNAWECISANGNALTNGVIANATNYFDSFYQYPYWMKIPSNKIDIITADIVSETGDNFGRLDLDKKFITTGVSSLTSANRYKIARSKAKHLLPYEFTYGYCITTWKAQGSEWENVLGIEEGHPWDREDHKRYLYTLVTRASGKVVLIRKD